MSDVPTLLISSIVILCGQLRDLFTINGKRKRETKGVPNDLIRLIKFN